VSEIRAAAPPGLHLVGASFDGVGVPAVVGAARQLGETLVA
jgi:protoporphyrinogen oxidase